VNEADPRARTGKKFAVRDVAARSARTPAALGKAPTCGRCEGRGTGVAASVTSEERPMIFRVLLYLVLMLGLAVRERVVRVR
jgi:hypothetical protein